MRLLEVVGLTKRFAGLTALDSVSFTAEEGQILGLLGPNGAGKTTCFDCLSGSTRLDTGRVIFDGREVTGEPPHRLAQAGVARTFQIARPFQSLTAAENVAVGLGCRRDDGPAARRNPWHGATARRTAIALLERVGLGDRADDPAGRLPVAMVKRLEVARALALDPRLILLDEPLGGLSPAEASALCALIAELRAEGMTVVLAEHNVGPALALADRVVVLDHGVLIASGRTERVRSDPRIAEVYFGEAVAARGPDRVARHPVAGGSP